MKVFVLIPVFNRLAHTREILDCLRRQGDVNLQIVVVDDGSMDGTAEFLAAQPDIITLKGNGQLWWAGAIHLALRTIHPMLQPGDFFAFMNNDTRIDIDFLSVLMAVSLDHQRAAVGSVVRLSQHPHRLLDIGAQADLRKQLIWEMADKVSAEELEQPQSTYFPDYLSGRGVIYPGEVLEHTGYMRPLLLPHYFADYEFSDRVRRAGFKLLVSSRAATYSTADFGSQRIAASFWRRKFGKGSSDNALYRIIFFCLVGTPAQRLSAVPRMVVIQTEALMKRALSRIDLQAKLFSAQVTGRVDVPQNALLARVVILALLPVKALLHYIKGLISRLRFMLVAPRSTIARARILAALERRGGRRMEALHVFAAALLTELQQGKVLMLGAGAERHQPFFRRLRVATEIPAKYSTWPTSSGADLVFCTLESSDALVTLPQPETLVLHTRPGGVLYFACYAGFKVPDHIQQMLAELRQMQTIEVIVDGMAGWFKEDQHDSIIPDYAFSTGSPGEGDASTVRIFAARRIQSS